MGASEMIFTERERESYWKKHSERCAPVHCLAAFVVTHENSKHVIVNVCQLLQTVSVVAGGRQVVLVARSRYPTLESCWFFRSKPANKTTLAYYDEPWDAPWSLDAATAFRGLSTTCIYDFLSINDYCVPEHSRLVFVMETWCIFCEVVKIRRIPLHCTSSLLFSSLLFSSLLEDWNSW
jgi:hypothetical protein